MFQTTQPSVGEVGRRPVEVVGPVLRAPPTPVHQDDGAGPAMRSREVEITELGRIRAIGVTLRPGLAL